MNISRAVDAITASASASTSAELSRAFRTTSSPNKFIVPESTKKKHEALPSCTTYAMNSGTSCGTPGTNELLLRSERKSYYGIQEAQYHQTTGRTREAWG